MIEKDPKKHGTNFSRSEMKYINMKNEEMKIMTLFMVTKWTAEWVCRVGGVRRCIC